MRQTFNLFLKLFRPKNIISAPNMLISEPDTRTHMTCLGCFDWQMGQRIGAKKLPLTTQKRQLTGWLASADSVLLLKFPRKCASTRARFIHFYGFYCQLEAAGWLAGSFSRWMDWRVTNGARVAGCCPLDQTGTLGNGEFPSSFFGSASLTTTIRWVNVNEMRGRDSDDERRQRAMSSAGGKLGLCVSMFLGLGKFASILRIFSTFLPKTFQWIKIKINFWYHLKAQNVLYQMI